LILSCSGYKLDKKHIFSIVLMSEFDNIVNTPDEFSFTEAPLIEVRFAFVAVLLLAFNVLFEEVPGLSASAGTHQQLSLSFSSLFSPRTTCSGGSQTPTATTSTRLWRERTLPS
jgi:hypothetical protein